MNGPYPWSRLERLERRDIDLLRWFSRVTNPAAAHARAGEAAHERSALERIELTFLSPRSYGRAELCERIATWGTSVLYLQRGDQGRAYLTLPSRIARAASDLVLSFRMPEIVAPRPATWAERGVSALVVAALLGQRYGLTDVVVDVGEYTGAELVEQLCPASADPRQDPAGARDVVTSVIVVPVRISFTMEPDDRPARSFIPPEHITDTANLTDTAYLLADTAYLIVPRDQIDGLGITRLDARGRSSADRSTRHAHRLSRLARAPVTLPVIARAATVHENGLRSLCPGVVLVFEKRPESGYLRVARGGIPIALQPGRLHITGPYERGIQMSELLLEDAMVEVSCRLGHITMSAREVLQIEPGQVIPFDTPVGSPVDVLCGGKVIARGELLDVDGDVGIRILEVEER